MNFQKNLTAQEQIVVIKLLDDDVKQLHIELKQVYVGKLWKMLEKLRLLNLMSIKLFSFFTNNSKETDYWRLIV